MTRRTASGIHVIVLGILTTLLASVPATEPAWAAWQASATPVVPQVLAGRLGAPVVRCGETPATLRWDSIPGAKKYLVTFAGGPSYSTSDTSVTFSSGLISQLFGTLGLGGRHVVTVKAENGSWASTPSDEKVLTSGLFTGVTCLP